MIFRTALKLGISLFVSKRLSSILLISLYWLDKYHFYSAQGWSNSSYPTNHFYSVPTSCMNSERSLIPHYVYSGIPNLSLDNVQVINSQIRSHWPLKQRHSR